jgi:hypothetical protein
MSLSTPGIQYPESLFPTVNLSAICVSHCTRCHWPQQPSHSHPPQSPQSPSQHWVQGQQRKPQLQIRSHEKSPEYKFDNISRYTSKQSSGTVQTSQSHCEFPRNPKSQHCLQPSSVGIGSAWGVKSLFDSGMLIFMSVVPLKREIRPTLLHIAAAHVEETCFTIPY